MLYNELYGKLILLTKRNDITHVEIGKCINLAKGAITARAKRNTKMKETEIAAIEKYFNVNISDAQTVQSAPKYSFERQNNPSIKKEVNNFGQRLNSLQIKTDLSNKEISEILNLEEDEYLEYKEGDRKPNLKILNELKQNFKISVDWLLYGE